MEVASDLLLSLHFSIEYSCIWQYVCFLTSYGVPRVKIINADELYFEVNSHTIFCFSFNLSLLFISCDASFSCPTHTRCITDSCLFDTQGAIIPPIHTHGELNWMKTQEQRWRRNPANSNRLFYPNDEGPWGDVYSSHMLDSAGGFTLRRSYMLITLIKMQKHGPKWPTHISKKTSNFLSKASQVQWS